MRKFNLTKNGKGAFHFNLIANNNEVILSSETYNSKQGALNGIESVREHSQEFKCFEMRKSRETPPKDYFVLKAVNGETIGVSEMYESKAAMLNGIDSVMENAANAPIVFEGKDVNQIDVIEETYIDGGIYESGIDPYKEEE